MFAPFLLAYTSPFNLPQPMSLSLYFYSPEGKRGVQTEHVGNSLKSGALNSQAGVSLVAEPVRSHDLPDGTCHPSLPVLPCLPPYSDNHTLILATLPVWHWHCAALRLPTRHPSIPSVVLSTPSLFCPSSPSYLTTPNNSGKLWCPWMI